MTIRYPDVSGYQSGLSLRGAIACVAKATEGGSYTDSTFNGFRNQARALGIPFAAYHWINSTDVATQAAHAFAVIGGGTPVMWDAEASGATVGRILALTSAYRRLGGRATMCYLPRWWWQSIGSPDLRPLRSAGLALISSSYPSSGYSDTGPGWTAYGGVAPTIWQYTDSQLFNGRRVDFNAFRGTVAQLRAVFDGASSPPPPPPPGSKVEQIDRLIFPSPNNADRRIGNVFTDLDNLRDYLIAGSQPVPGDANWPKADSPLGKLWAFLNAPATPVTLTDAQLATLAAQVTAAMQPQLDKLHADIADLRARLAAGAQASHDALSG